MHLPFILPTIQPQPIRIIILNAIKAADSRKHGRTNRNVYQFSGIIRGTKHSFHGRKIPGKLQRIC